MLPTRFSTSPLNSEKISDAICACFLYNSAVSCSYHSRGRCGYPILSLAHTAQFLSIGALASWGNQQERSHHRGIHLNWSTRSKNSIWRRAASTNLAINMQLCLRIRIRSYIVKEDIYKMKIELSKEKEKNWLTESVPKRHLFAELHSKVVVSPFFFF